MPSCSIKRCSARKSNNQPHLTLHRVPRNEVWRRKWLDAIGIENLNPRHKELYICSLHFDESQFNRTLDQIRLRDNAVPTLFDVPSSSKLVPVLCDIGNVQREEAAAMSLPQESSDHEMLPVSSKTMPQPKPPKTGATGNFQEQLVTKECLAPACDMDYIQFSKLQKLQKICEEQRKKIKRLNEKVRRQRKKIATLEDLLSDLKQKMIINTEQSMVLEQCGGSQDFLKRQISKAKGVPLEKKYSEEIRKFALTLHFLSPKAYDYIRRVYNTCLPHPRTLSKWYQNVDADAGFTKEAFDTLKKKVEQCSPQKILCALVLDEIAIRKVWCGVTLL